MTCEATAEMTGVHLDTVRRKSCPFPGQVFERARALIFTGQVTAQVRVVPRVKR